jgi:hypothetical protein
METRWNPFVTYVIGPPDRRRYVLKKVLTQTPEYFAGSATEVWSEDLGKARLYSDLNDLGRDFHQLARSELSLMPQKTYRLEAELTVIGETTEDELRQYVDHALKIGIDYESHGPGPGLGVLVLARTDLASLRPEGVVE